MRNAIYWGFSLVWVLLTTYCIGWNLGGNWGEWAVGMAISVALQSIIGTVILRWRW